MLNLLQEAKAFHLIGETPLFCRMGKMIIYKWTDGNDEDFQRFYLKTEEYYSSIVGAICFAKELKGGNNVYTDYRSNAFMG